MSKSNESPEDRLIARYFRPLATAAGAFGLIDDAAALTPPPGCDLVLTTDGVIAGVHFFADDPPEMVSRKVLRMNLSDLAAKGARPLGFLLSVALPAGFGEAWLGAFAAGLADDAARYGCPLYGGDTDHTPGPISVSIFAVRRRAAGKNGAPLDRAARRPHSRHRHDWRRGDRIAASARPDAGATLGAFRCRCRAARRPLSLAAAAQRARRCDLAVRVGGDRRIRRTCRRSRQALPRVVGRGRHRCRSRAALGRCTRSDRGRAGTSGDRAHRRRRL